MIGLDFVFCCSEGGQAAFDQYNFNIKTGSMIP